MFDEKMMNDTIEKYNNDSSNAGTMFKLHNNELYYYESLGAWCIGFKFFENDDEINIYSFWGSFNANSERVKLIYTISINNFDNSNSFDYDSMLYGLGGFGKYAHIGTSAFECMSLADGI